MAEPRVSIVSLTAAFVVQNIRPHVYEPVVGARREWVMGHA